MKMPRRNIAGSFEGKPAYRWRKGFQHGGHKVWYVLCRALKPNEIPKPNYGYLGLPESMWTEPDSQNAANLWWDKKKKQLAIESVPEELATIDKKIAFASIYRNEELEHLQKVKREILKSAKQEPDDREAVLDDETEIQEQIKIAGLFGITVPQDLDPIAASSIFGKQKVWEDRLSTIPTTPKDKTFKYELENFLDDIKTNMKPQSYRDVAAYLKKVKDHFGESFDCSTINEATIDLHYKWLKNQAMEGASKNKRLGMFRRFVKWLWKKKTIEIEPRNLIEKVHRTKVVTKAVKKYHGVKEEIARLPKRNQLWALLGLNCGMTQADLGQLTWEMIDMKNGTLTRKRVKTEDKQKTPTVTYKLFPETMKLLKELENKKGLVFQTKDGKPLYSTYFDEQGNAKKKDLISLYWKRTKNPKPTISLSRYRSIGATTLKENEIFRQYREYFLGHGASTVADKFYAAEADDPFFRALDFIHAKIFEAK
jgi:integrase